MENSNPIPSETKQKIEENSSFNLKWLFSTLLVIWPWMLGSVIIALIIGNLYLRYATPIYSSYAELLIMDSKRGNATAEDDILQMLNMGRNNINIDNEIEVLKSRTTMSKVVSQLHLNVNYYVAGRFKNTTLYDNKPFELVLPDSVDLTYRCKVENDGAEGYIMIAQDGRKIHAKWGDTVSVEFGKVVLRKTAAFSVTKLQYTVNVVPIVEAASRYMSTLNIGLPSKQSSHITISMTDIIPERSVDIINILMKIYMQNNIEDRNKVSNNIMAFINDRIDTVNHELTGIEKGIEQFKQQNNIANIGDQSQTLINSNAAMVDKLKDEEVALDVLSSISDYIQKADDRSMILPASLLDNPGLAGLMNKYNTIQTEIETSLISTTPNNPITKNLIHQKNEVKQNIMAALASSKKELEIKVGKLKEALGIASTKIKEVPAVERLFLEYSRRQNIKQEIYVFLLKKREETAMQKAAMVANANVIDPAISSGAVFPNHSKILMMSLLLGMGIPFSIIVLRRALNIKIISKSDILKVTAIPIIGEIGNNHSHQNIAVTKNSRTLISEQFRALRTNLQYLLIDKKDKVLMITSSMSREGKSFIAVNLSITLAMSGKKVILLEMDLRKPKIAKMLNIDGSIGFSSFSIGKADYNEMIIPSGIDPNLFIIPSGPVPPNPSELIFRSTTEELFQRLRNEYDYVIIDTSPVGLVTDAQLLNKFVDTTLYIVRQGLTYKQQINIPNDLFTSGKMPRMSIVVNDIVANRGFAYGYGYEEGYAVPGYGYSYGYTYGYGYGSSYGNGYYVEDERKGILNWLKFKKR